MEDIRSVEYKSLDWSNILDLPNILLNEFRLTVNLKFPSSIQGSVTPFALINDVGGSVTFLLDSVFAPKGIDAAADSCLAYFHPLTNDATVGVKKTDFIKFLDCVSHPPMVLEL